MKVLRSARWCVLLVPIAVNACGSSPAGPETVLNLELGLQNVTFLGLGISSDPSLPPCTPLAMPPGGTSISTQVMHTVRDVLNGIVRAHGESA